MRSILRTIAILCLTFSIVPVLGAQEPAEDRAGATAPTFFGETGLFQTMSGSTVEKGRYTFGVYLNAFRHTLAPAPELAPPSARRYEDYAVALDRFSASLGYGITDRWEVTVQMPVLSLKGDAGDRAGYSDGFPYVGKFADSGAGNLHVGTKFGLLSPKSSHSLAATGFIDFNTGKGDTGLATGNPDYGVGLAWNRRIYYASTYYTKRGRRDSSKSPSGERFRVANEFHADLGFNIPLGTLARTNWITEVNMVWHVGGDAQPDDIVSVATGIRHWMGDTPWALSAAVRDNVTALVGDSGTSGFGFLAGIHYAPTRAVVAPPPPPPPVPVPLPETAPPIATVPSEPRAPQELRTDVIGFDKSSARVTNVGKALLDDVALRLRQEPAATAIVTGQADSSESMGSGNDLDRRRAEAVKDYLVSRHGIDPLRITVESGGVTGTMVAVVRLVAP
jgi:outer membrane protein OmpA-like peptidoglycan-associated protein